MTGPPDNFSASLIPAVGLDTVRSRSGTRSSFYFDGEIRGEKKNVTLSVTVFKQGAF